MYECMYVCMYECMHVCMHVRMHVCMYVCMYVMYVYMYVFLNEQGTGSIRVGWYGKDVFMLSKKYYALKIFNM